MDNTTSADFDQPLPTSIDFPDLDSSRLILFTSGTTNKPKGVVLSLKSVISRVGLNKQQIGQNTMFNSLCTLPLNFGHGLIGNCLTPLLHGCNLFILEPSDLNSLVKFGEVIDEKGITFLSSVPAFWNLVLKLSSPPRKGTLSRVHVGSAPMSAVLWQRIIDWATCDVVNMYGITENCNWVAGASSDNFAPEDGLVGKMWGGEASVLTTTGNRQSRGEGILLIRTPTLMRGYLDDEITTNSVFRGNWFITGDIARIDDKGIVKLIGREVYAVNKAGIKIYPEEIDALVERNDEVVEACAFGLPDPISGDLLGVALVACDRESFCTASLRSWLARRLAKEKLPDRILLWIKYRKTRG